MTPVEDMEIRLPGADITGFPAVGRGILEFAVIEVATVVGKVIKEKSDTLPF